MRTPGIIALSATLAATSAACAIGETTEEVVTIPARIEGGPRECSGEFAKVDLAPLKACGTPVTGKGHCYDGSKSYLTQLPDCGGGQLCVPDKILASAGGKLKSCTFFIGNKPGVCMSMLVKDIEAHKNELKQDVCDADERCTPCVDPTNGRDTQLCAPIGVYEKPCTGGDGSAPKGESCCHGSGVCSNPDAIPADSREYMHRDACPAAKVCIPNAMVEGKPVKCDVLGTSGVCLDLCFAKMLQGTSAFMRGGCRATEVCLPCALGKGQGMPGCEHY